MSPVAALLARGPWDPAQVHCDWREDVYEPHAEAHAAADAAVSALRERGSPSHDGLSGRLANYDASNDRLWLELQPARWSLRLGQDALSSLAALCVTRAADGRWLAGRRANCLTGAAGARVVGGRNCGSTSPTTDTARCL